MTDSAGCAVSLGAGLVLLATLVCCRPMEEAEHRSAERVTVARPAPSPEGSGYELLPRDYGHVGVVVRERRVVVVAPFDARLVERFVQPGEEVYLGQPIARFDSESVDRALDVALAAVMEAEASLKVARVEEQQARERYERRRGRRELFSQEQLAEVEAEVEVSRARRESAEARLAAVRAEAEHARAEAAKATLHAPMDGVVDEVYGSPGMYDTRGAPVAAIEAGEWHVRFAAPPEALFGLSPGAAITVTFEDHEPARGFIIYASPELDPRTLLLTFEALLCSDDLPAGTPVRVVSMPQLAEGKPQRSCPETPGRDLVR